MAALGGFNIGDKVKWAYPEPNSDSEDLLGEVVDIDDSALIVLVKWHDGELEEFHMSDLHSIKGVQ